MQQQNNNYNNNNNNGGGSNKPNFELKYTHPYRTNEKTGKPMRMKHGSVWIKDKSGNIVDPNNFPFTIYISCNDGAKYNVYAPYDETRMAQQNINQAQRNQSPQPHQQSPQQQGNQQQNFGQQNNFPDGNYEPVTNPYDDYSHGR
jgi:hypothetical protein